MVTNLQHLDLEKTYTYADYLQWRVEEQLELIKGKIFKMSPAPKRVHQKISRNIFKELSRHNDFVNCELYYAPFDVRLPTKGLEDQDIYTVVQPDICIICDKSKLDERGCLGAPDLVIEIISPATAKKDLQDKFALYQEHGILEYWIVHTEEKIVDVFYLENGKYLLDKMYVQDDTVHSQALPGMKVDLTEVFVEG